MEEITEDNHEDSTMPKMVPRDNEFDLDSYDDDNNKDEGSDYDDEGDSEPSRRPRTYNIRHRKRYYNYR